MQRRGRGAEVTATCVCVWSWDICDMGRCSVRDMDVMCYVWYGLYGLCGMIWCDMEWCVMINVFKTQREMLVLLNTDVEECL